MLEVAGIELLPPLATFLAFALAGLALNIVPGADMTSVFPGVLIHSGPRGNTLFVASSKPELRFVRQPDFSEVHPQALEDVRAAYLRLREPHPDHGRVLTDDYNPVEFYDAVNREETRKNLAQHVKVL